MRNHVLATLLVVAAWAIVAPASWVGTVQSQPSAPPSFSASAGVGAVTLSWTASTSTSSSTRYYIFRSAASASLTTLTPATATTAIAAGVGGVTNNVTYVNQTTSAGTVTFTDATVSNGQYYYYVAIASNSATSSASTSGPSPYDKAIPAVSGPSGLTASAGDSQVYLSWTAASSTNSSTRYYLFRAVGGTASLNALSPVTATTAIAAGTGTANATNNVTYVANTTSAGALSLFDTTAVNGTTYCRFTLVTFAL